MLTLESLNQITTDRILQGTGLIEPGDADVYILSQLAHRIGFLNGQEYGPPTHHAEYLSQAHITRVSRALAQFGNISTKNESPDAVIWTPPWDGGMDHAVIARDFQEVTGSDWETASFRDSVGGYLVEIDKQKPAVILDDRWPESYAIRESDLEALERASRLLNVAQICVAHSYGKYTLFDEGNRTIKSLRTT